MKYSQYKFNIDGWHEATNFGAARQAYTAQGWHEWQASQSVLADLNKLGVERTYSGTALGRASLDQLCRIRDILREKS